MRSSRKLVLCESRHEMPPDCEGHIFPHTIDLSDLDRVQDIADKIVCQCKCDGRDLDVYVTGIQAPLVAVINSANRREVKLVLWHWNPCERNYYKQEVYQNFWGIQNE